MTISKPWGHVLQAIVLQVVIGLIFSAWWAGMAAATAWFLEREISQAEYRWIAIYGGGLRENMPWWGGIDYRVWKLSDAIDWIAPFTATLLIALLVTL